jgi:hypothetical protein
MASNFLCRTARTTCNYFGQLIIDLCAHNLGSILSESFLRSLFRDAKKSATTNSCARAALTEHCRAGTGCCSSKGRREQLASLSRLVAALALELGRRLAGLHHRRGGLTAATALSHELRRQLHDGFGRRRHGPIALGSQLRLCQRWSSGSLLHSGALIPGARRASLRPPRLSASRSGIPVSSVRVGMSILAA